MKWERWGLFTILFVFSLFLSAQAADTIILNINGLGNVKANPVRHTLTFNSYGGPVEFSVCWNKLHWVAKKGLYAGSERCIQGEVGGWAKEALKREQKQLKCHITEHSRLLSPVITR